MPKNNPFDAAAAGAPDPDLDKPLTPEEYALYKRLAARVMRQIGKQAKGASKGGQARTEAKIAAVRENGKKGGRPRKPDSELKRPRREKKAKAETAPKA